MRHLLLASAALIIPAAANADSGRIWHDSYIELHEPTVSGAIATVTFQNEEVHGGDEHFDLTYQDITISVEMEWTVNRDGDERMIVHTPEGYVASPRSIDVAETTSGQIHIYKYQGS